MNTLALFLGIIHILIYYVIINIFSVYNKYAIYNYINTVHKSIKKSIDKYILYMKYSIYIKIFLLGGFIIRNEEFLIYLLSFFKAIDVITDFILIYNSIQIINILIITLPDLLQYNKIKYKSDIQIEKIFDYNSKKNLEFFSKIVIGYNIIICILYILNIYILIK